MHALVSLRKDLHAAANPKKAAVLAGFFRIGKGEYGEGDVFLGLTVPQSRIIARKHAVLRMTDIRSMLASRFHEERLIALLLLVDRYEHGDATERKRITAFYLANTERVNNWDLVDLSAHQILGRHLLETRASTAVLDRLARSKNLWRRRIAIVATYAFIRAGRLGETFRIADALLADKHDLIHKATGWMLREAGKRDKAALVRWLKLRHKTMPRTMLRYAIERFPETERKKYLLGKA
jgi:3-methyladenine DNA glycosylase AlkD